MWISRRIDRILVACVRAIRSGFPAILCTDFSDRLTEECLRAPGPVGFAMKPLNLEEITGQIRDVLEKETA
jgi:DNA-binding NarL/FixJ family response regulator